MKLLARFAAAIVTILMATGEAPAVAGIVMTADAAGVQSSTVAGVTTETFNGLAPGQYSSLNTAVGTLSASGLMSIVPADHYGGAAGTGNYFAIGAQSGSADPVTLTLNGDHSYFGMLWSAADPNNEVQLYSGKTLVATYTTASVFASLGSAYYGNPSNRQDTGEKFAYINFAGTDGTSFDEIVFSNSGTTSTGFESDNWSLNVIVPEPSTLVLAGTAIAVGAVILVRRRLRFARAMAA